MRGGAYLHDADARTAVLIKNFRVFEKSENTRLESCPNNTRKQPEKENFKMTYESSPEYRTECRV